MIAISEHDRANIFAFVVRKPVFTFPDHAPKFREIFAPFLYCRAMRHSLATACAFLALIASYPATPVAAQSATVDLRILAINDFHGYLRASSGGIRIADPNDRTKRIAVPAGGAEPFSETVPVKGSPPTAGLGETLTLARVAGISDKVAVAVALPSSL